jgi:peptidoglycan/LPS O-acetylase OafA/YrhL
VVLGTSQYRVRNPMKRDPRLDLLRVAAIGLVTLFHVWRFIGRPSEVIGPFDLAAPLEKGAMGVTIFIFLSGYLCQSRSAFEKPGLFLRRKLLRLAPPYYVALIVWNVLLSLGVTAKTHTLWDNVSHVLFIHNLTEPTFYSVSGVFWYIALQVQFFIVYAVLRRPISFHPTASVTVSLMMSVASSTVMPVSFPVLDRSVFAYAFPFVLGVVTASRPAWCAAVRRWSVFALSAVGTIVVSAIPSLLPWGRLDFIFNGLLICLLALSVPSGKHLKPLGSLCAQLAVASYSIYLYNYIFQCFHPTLVGVGGLLVYTGIVLSFGTGAFFLVEKPIDDRLKRRFANKSMQATPNGAPDG